VKLIILLHYFNAIKTAFFASGGTWDDKMKNMQKIISLTLRPSKDHAEELLPNGKVPKSLRDTVDLKVPARDRKEASEEASPVPPQAIDFSLRKTRHIESPSIQETSR
jgi:hypothetical protein